MAILPTLIRAALVLACISMMSTFAYAETKTTVTVRGIYCGSYVPAQGILDALKSRRVGLMRAFIMYAIQRGRMWGSHADLRMGCAIWPDAKIILDSAPPVWHSIMEVATPYEDPYSNTTYYISVYLVVMSEEEVIALNALINGDDENVQASALVKE